MIAFGINTVVFPLYYPITINRMLYSDSIDLKERHTVSAPPAPRPPMKVTNFARTYETPAKGTYALLIEKCGLFFGWWGIWCCLCESPYKEVRQGEVGLVEKFGALSRTVEPGLCTINTWSEKLTRVSVKVNIDELPQLTCFSKDNVSILVTSVVYYNIVDPFKAIYDISDINLAIRERTQTTLRDVIGNRSLQDVVEKREEIAQDIEKIISKIAFDWGVHVDSILIKDLTLPKNVQESLSKATEAKRIGESKIINARAEVELAKLMRKAADILASKPAMQIRYLDALQAVAKNAGLRVIFMPSSQEVERMSEGATYLGNPEKAKAVDLELDDQWDKHQDKYQQIQPVRRDDSGVVNTVAVNEALYH